MAEDEVTAVMEEAAPESPTVDPEVVESSCRVDLDAFSGPLDLLLYLVRKAEVDVADIPIVAIADQFVATIERWEDADLEKAGDFILMAATLLEIKARLIAPPREVETDDDEVEPIDPRASLIEQLMAFREVKEQVLVLEALEAERARYHHRGWVERIPEDPEAAAGIDLENADVFQLFAAWDRIAKIIAGHGPRTVLFNDIPIEERRREIIARMRELKRADLLDLLQQVPDSIHRVGIVIAALDCIRSRHLRATQFEQYGPVHLEFVEDIDRQRPLEMEAGESELPEEMAPKGRRGRPRPVLRTFDGLTEAGDDADAEAVAADDEAYQLESDEDRFVRELNEGTGIDAILKRNARLDELVHEHLLAEGLVDPDAVVDGTAVPDEAGDGPVDGADDADDPDDDLDDDEDDNDDGDDDDLIDDDDDDLGDDDEDEEFEDDEDDEDDDDEEEDDDDDGTWDEDAEE